MAKLFLLYLLFQIPLAIVIGKCLKRRRKRQLYG
jgi:ABC-type uncharacterized transport system permease subunit